MPMHDWTRVEPGIYHAFHHSWIEEISRALNRGLLPEDYYALAEQQAGGFGPDVLTLQERNGQEKISAPTATKLAQPKTRFRFEAPSAFYRRKKSTIVVRHVSGDRIVAMVEIMSPGNKSSAKAFRDFVNKAEYLLENGVHLLLVDPFPPSRRDPDGIHAVIWANVEEQPFELPADKQLTLVSYESAEVIRAYVDTISVGDRLPEMPLYLDVSEFVEIPLESTYELAWNAVPGRWQKVVCTDSH